MSEVIANSTLFSDDVFGSFRGQSLKWGRSRRYKFVEFMDEYQMPFDM